MEKDPERIPLIRFEDEHLLVLNKPAGMNTHAPAPFAGEGIYDWLRHREPRWSRLAILHRTDQFGEPVLRFDNADVHDDEYSHKVWPYQLLRRPQASARAGPRI